MNPGTTISRFASGLPGILALAIAVAVSAGSARAADVGVTGQKLIVIDTLATNGKARVVFSAKDGAIENDGAANAASISAVLQMSYAGGAADGSFVIPRGDAGWVVNDEKGAKFLNDAAPAGSTQTKVSQLRSGKAVSLIAAGLGDTEFDILAAGAPEAVHTAYCVDNDGVENCFCSVFTDCAYKSVAGGEGAKLSCKAGAADDDCLARCAGSACPIYDWSTSSYSPCSATCGEGMQTRTVECVEQNSMSVVADSFCDEAGPKPVSQQACNAGVCPVYGWVEGGFGECSVTCGGGSHTQTVQCVEQNSMSVVADSFCSDAGPKPATIEACNTDPCPSYDWAAGGFGECSAGCGSGTQTRTVQCVEQSSMTVVADSFCDGAGTKPATTQACESTACNYVWQTGSFGSCSVSCGDGQRSRTVQCRETVTDTTVSDALCSGAGPKPATTEACNMGPCTSWFTTAWAPAVCPSPCIPGTTQTRAVFCTNTSFEFLPDSSCASSGPKPPTQRACC